MNPALAIAFMAMTNVSSFLIYKDIRKFRVLDALSKLKVFKSQIFALKFAFNCHKCKFMIIIEYKCSYSFSNICTFIIEFEHIFKLLFVQNMQGKK